MFFKMLFLEISQYSRLSFCEYCGIFKKTALLQITFGAWFCFHEKFLGKSLREKCPNTGLFLVRIFLYSVQIQKNTDQ